MVSAERKVKPDHSKNAGLKIGGSLSGADLVCDTYQRSGLFATPTSMQSETPPKVLNYGWKCA